MSTLTKPLFRSEAMAEPAYGEAFAFGVPRWPALAIPAAATLPLLTLLAVVADFDRVATVPGTIVPAAGLSRLIAPQSGTVAAVAVPQGSAVERGRPLIRISATSFLADGAAVPVQMLETYRKQQRLAGQQLDAELKRVAAERGQLNAQLAQLSASQSSLQTQITLQNERIKTNRDRLENLRLLRSKGFVSLISYQSQEETVMVLGQQLAVLQQNLSTNVHEKDEVRLRLSALDAQSRSQELQFAGTQSALERGATGAQAASEVTMAAPVSGVLTSVRAVPGQTVRAGEELGAIMKQGDRMQALLLVSPSAIGSIHKGQRVTIRYDAFPYQRYGLGRGVVDDVGSSAATEPAANGSVRYRVLVRLTSPPPLAPDAFLKPDLSLSAGIVVERRSLLDWLLSPIRERLRESRSRRDG